MKPQPEIPADIEAEMRAALAGTPYEGAPLSTLLTGAWHSGEGPDCPYGSPGERLWVRETWRPVGPWECRKDGATIQCRADGAYLKQFGWPDSFRIKSSDGRDRWKPSIFMPRWASRITLEITEVRAQRLQEISEEDAQAEGCEIDCSYVGGRCNSFRCAQEHYRKGYKALWDGINGKKHPWASNEYVWVVSFKRL